MIFYSPELNEFILVTILSVNLHTKHNQYYVECDSLHDHEMFSKYAFYFVGDL